MDFAEAARREKLERVSIPAWGIESMDLVAATGIRKNGQSFHSRLGN